MNLTNNIKIISLEKRIVFMVDLLLYFAYGSNMYRKRLSDRIGFIDKWDNGTVLKKQLSFNKLGQDGSGRSRR